MLQRPKFKPHLQLATVPEEGLFVLTGGRDALLRGRLYQLVAPLIDGREADQICDALRPEASAAEVYYTLVQLQKKGFLTEADDRLAAENSAWWSLHEVEPQVAATRLADRAVSVRGLGVSADPLCELLEDLGVRISEEGLLDVLVVDHYLRPDIAAQNVRALGQKQPWLILKPLGAQFWLGPVFRPGETGCWNCLAERLRSNRAIENYLVDRGAVQSPLAIDQVGTKASRQVAWGLAAGAIAAWIVRGELPEGDGQVRTFDHYSWQTKVHALPKLPYCTACGFATQGTDSPDEAGTAQTVHDGPLNGHAFIGERSRFQPIRLENRAQTFARDGGHRVVSPDATLARYVHHVSPITGAVPMLERSSPPGDSSMHVYLAGNNLSRQHRNLLQLQGDLRQMSSGKGTTDAQARASGLCEGLERYSGVFRGDEPRRRARLADLGESGIDVRQCLLFSDRQFRERDAINTNDSAYGYVPLPYDEGAEIEWSPLWSLTRQEVRYLPTAFCYYDYPQPVAERFCIADSNGCAAGNTREEAVLQGFLELVERDSVALWWYNRIPRPGIDLESFEDPYLQNLTHALAGYHREMHVIDLTADLEIPVFAAWCRRIDTPAERKSEGEQIVLGFGAHLDPRIALLRAVTEMNQMLSHLVQSPLDRGSREHVTDLETVEWLKTATAENQPWLLPERDRPQRTTADYHAWENDDLVEDVRRCQRQVERAGLEMLVLDQTRPEIELPVVKVIVPGLRHFWTRFGPGRLYDVPVQLGWIDRPLSEAELNPIPMFM